LKEAMKIENDDILSTKGVLLWLYIPQLIF
jgi:hypothetical protein